MMKGDFSMPTTGEAIILYLTRYDGRRERAQLHDRTFQEARKTVRGMFHSAPGLYVKAEIRRAGKLVATLTSKLAAWKAKQLLKI